MFQKGERSLIDVNKKLLSRVFWGVCGCIVLYWLLHDVERVKAVKNTLSSVFSPFVIGAVLAFILNVPMRFLESVPFKKVKNAILRRTLAVVLTFIFLLLVLSLVIWLLVPQLVNTLNSLVPALMDFASRVEVMLKNWLDENPAVL